MTTNPQAHDAEPVCGGFLRASWAALPARTPMDKPTTDGPGLDASGAPTIHALTPHSLAAYLDEWMTFDALMSRAKLDGHRAPGVLSVLCVAWGDGLIEVREPIPATRRTAFRRTRDKALAPRPLR